MQSTRPGPLRRAWDRALRGDRRWGSFAIHADRMGVTRYRLVVFPPGITDAERRDIRIARGWPFWGLMLWLGFELVFAHTIGPWTALALSTSVTIGAGVIAMLRAGGLRSQVRTMTVAVLAGFNDSESTHARKRLIALAAELLEADQLLERDEIDVASHEAIWWRVYGRLTAHTVPAAG